VTITLFGARPPTKAERDALPPTFKGIVVSSTGSLDLHGQRFYRTLLGRLCSTAARQSHQVASVE
jgi:hypothetical protein